MAAVSVPLAVVVLPQDDITECQVGPGTPVQVLHLTVLPEKFTIYCQVNQARLQVQPNTEVKPGVN